MYDYSTTLRSDMGITSINLADIEKSLAESPNKDVDFPNQSLAQKLQQAIQILIPTIHTKTEGL
jgi:hypothetical protein